MIKCITQLVFILLSICSSQGEKKVYEFFLKEEKPAGSIVGQIQGDFEKLKQNSARDIFFVNSNSGYVITRIVIDRESLSDEIRKNGFRFNVVLDNKTRIKVIVYIIDINDNIPNFFEKDFYLTVSESIQLKSEIAIPSAKDEDEPRNAITIYSIASGNTNNYFDIVTKSKTSLFLHVQKHLDYETTKQLHLNISACDIELHKCDFSLIHIEVEDANDNKPIFEHDTYYVSIFENTTTSSPVIRVKADDKDSGDNGEVYYSLADINDKFSINLLTGQIYLQHEVDAEKRTSYLLVPVASDKGDPLLKSNCKVFVTILDCNDKSPQIEVMYYLNGKYHVRENEKVGVQVANISVWDSDRDSKNNKVSLALIDGFEYFSMRHIKHHLYGLFVKKPLDREKQRTVNLKINAYDSGIPQLSTIYQKLLNVKDDNDHDPRFVNNVYKVKFLESERKGFELVTVKATDGDEGLNADILYIIFPASKWYEVDEKSGVITLTKRVDREKISFMKISVRARDKGKQPRTATCIIEITILDVNDNAPEFPLKKIIFNITENNKPNEVLGSVVATDKDIVESDHIYYSLAEKSDKFSINRKSGELIVLKSLDREEHAEYDIRVYATDGGGLRGYTNVIIYINDVDDYPPHFQTSFFNISIHENFPLHKEVARVTAIDLDENGSSSLVYSGDRLRRMFSIDPNTGAIKLEKKLKIKRHRYYTFTVYVHSKKSGGLDRQSASVRINVIPANKRELVFEQKEYHFKIRENNQKHQKISNVKAKRAISGNSNFIRYKIIEDWRYDVIKEKLFSIDNNGMIYVEQSIDFENRNLFKLKISAIDSLYRKSTASTYVFVRIIDENDNIPRFVMPHNYLPVAEGVSVGKVLFSFKAIDLDSDKNGEVTYRVLNGSLPFNITPNTGEIFTTGSLDYEQTQSYEVTLEACDNGVPRLSSTVTIHIDVLDVNDNAPRFDLKSHKASVKEGATSGTSVFVLKAIDPDSGENGQFSFFLEQKLDFEHFLLLNGNLILRHDLDREVKEAYMVSVFVRDKGTPPLENYATVTLAVIDVNDQPPTFEYASYKFEILEESPPGQVGELYAYDEDKGDNGVFICTLLNELEYFQVDLKQHPQNSAHKFSCVIMSLKTFNSETDKQSYELKINASDFGTPKLTSQITVVVNIININDEIPKFSRDIPYTGCVSNGAGKGELVTNIKAFDKDAVPLKIMYKIVEFENSDSEALDLFSIDLMNGTVYTKAKILTDKPKFEVIIVAQEVSQNISLCNVQKLVIFVIPYKTLRFFTESCFALTLPEDQKLGTIRIPLSQKESYYVTNYALENFKYNPFRIRRATGLLQLINQLSYQVNQFYQLKVTAQGRLGSQEDIKMTESFFVNILIMPTNHHVPFYPSNPETFTVLENGKSIVKVGSFKRPIDSDVGMEGSCLFSIIETSPYKLPIQIIPPWSRDVYVIMPLDREQKRQYDLKVKITDLAVDIRKRLSNTFTISLFVQDVNDNAPVFKSRNLAYVSEYQAIGSSVLNIVAEDPDVGETHTDIGYSILSGNERQMFHLDYISGALTVHRLPLDINEQRDYVFTVMAKEIRNPDGVPKIQSLNSTMVVKIRVIDINDNPPKFSQSVYSTSIKEGQKINTEIMRLNSTDRDFDERFRAVVYELTDHEDIFRVDHLSGALTSLKVFDRETDELFVLNAIVRNTEPPYGQDSCKINVAIEDINDHPPVFTEGGHIEIKVLENSPPGVIHKFFVTDKDRGLNAQNIFKLIIMKGARKFRVDPSTGELYLLKSLDRERRKKYRFSVEAMNINPPHMKAVQNVTITVLDENDEKPVFTKRVYKSYLNEAHAQKSIVLKVEAYDGDEGQNALIMYSLKQSNDTGVAEHFEINADTGEISCVVPVDYEKKKEYRFKVRANGVGTNHFDEAQVIIYVEDSNDNKPMFKKSVYEVDLLEITLYMLVAKVKAFDADEDGRQKVYYEFDPPSEQFEIDKRTGEIRLMRTDIMLGQYHLNVVAKDLGQPSLENTAKVFVTIGSQNTVLKFLNSTVIFSINENPKQNAILGKLMASSTKKGKISYSITAPSNPFNAFHIGKYSGILSVSNHTVVDYEKYHGFLLGIIASIPTHDGSINSYLAVVVNLTDVNDNYPYISPPFGKMYYQEKYITGPTYFSLYSVYDADSIDQGKLKLDIVAGNEEQVFRIFPGTFIMYINKPIDYEKQKEFNLVIQVTDSANHSNKSYLKIIVEDKNDNPPEFNNLTPLNVKEDTIPGTIVKNITVFEIDVNSKRIFNVVSSPYFSIDTNTGALVLEKRLDFEQERELSVNISVNDGWFTVYGTLTVNVIDANDNSPRFTQYNYVIPIKSTLKKNTYITKVKATDVDQGVNGLVKYKISPPSDEFSIEQETGVIFATKDKIFQPEIDSYPLGVVAFDGGEISRSTSITLHLSIDGELNTFAPEFLQRFYSISVVEGSVIGAPIETVLAYFPKTVQRSLSYRIVQGNVKNAFSVDPSSGIVSINSELDRETLDIYALEILAEQQDSNISAKCTMLIEIKDANDNPPIFEQNSYNITIPEETQPGVSLITVHANDADDPRTKNGRIVYEIHSGQDDYEWLSVDRDTGQVIVQRTLDREMRARIQLTIKASDYDGAGTAVFSSLNVTITDINDNTPQFSVDVASIYELQVNENEPPGTIVFKAHAEDPDEGANGRISFRILNSSQPTPFMMKDTYSGWVFTNSILDYEKISLYNLTIVAQDHGKPQRSASFEYRIAVTDVNEYKPEFLKTEYNFLVYANLRVDSIVGRVYARDRDKGNAGKIRFTFVGDVKLFHIDETSGIIKVKDDLRLHKTIRYRRDIAGQNSDEIGEKLYKIKADNFDNSTLFDHAVIKIKINYSCPNCIIKTAVPLDPDESFNSSTTIIVVALIGLCFSILFVACCFVYCRRHKRPCLQKPRSDLFFSDKHIVMDTYFTEREYLTGGTTSGNDRIQNRLYSEFEPKDTPQESSGTDVVQESNGTVRSVSVTDKASTFSFGIYHEQSVPESQIQPFTEGVSDMCLKDLERNNVFGYPLFRKNRKPASLISRSTQESSLYSMPSTRLVNTNRNKPFGLRNRTVSHESLKDFQEEGGGEAAGGLDVGNLLYAKLADVNADEEDVVLDRVKPFQEEGGLSRLGSLSTIMCEEEEIEPPYNYRFSERWKNEYNELSPLFPNQINVNKSNNSTRLPPFHTSLPSQNTSEIPILNNNTNANSLRKNVDMANSPVTAFNQPHSNIMKSPSINSIGNKQTFIPVLSSPKQYDVITYAGMLERSESVASQLSKITLSDINISDEDEL